MGVSSTMRAALAASLPRTARNGRAWGRALAARGVDADRSSLRAASRVAWSSTRPRRPGYAGTGLELRIGASHLGPVHVRTESPLGRAHSQACHAVVLVPDRSHDRR